MTSNEKTFKVKVMTFNIQQLYDMGPKTWWDQGNRAARIPDAIRSYCETDNSNNMLDVLILNECFNSNATAIALELKDLFPFQTPVIGKSLQGWNSTTGSFRNNWNVINGGAMILSRHEIVDQRQYIYKNTHPNTWDCWANKGIAYAKVNVEGKHAVHILGTHLQADEGHVPHVESHAVRMTQLQEMRKYIVEDLKLPKTECVIMGGDLNVDYTNDVFRKELETSLHANIYYDHILPGSYSAPHNWLTKANARANRQSEERNETLDYLLVPADYVQPVNNTAKFIVVPLKAADSWYWSYLAKHWPEHEGLYSELSDHYPVLASFEFTK